MDHALVRKSAASRRYLPAELQAYRGAAAPHDFAMLSLAAVAGVGQPQPGMDRARIVHADLGAAGRHIDHSAGPRGKAAVEDDPGGLLHRLANVAGLLGAE